MHWTPIQARLLSSTPNVWSSSDQIAQEFRLTSPADRTFSWMVGAYYQQHDLDSSIPIYIAAGVGFQGTVIEESTWESVFFSGTYNISDEFRTEHRRSISGR